MKLLGWIKSESLIGILILPFLWLLVADCLHAASPLLLLPLSEVLNRLYQISSSGDLTIDLGYTLLRWSMGFFLGVFAGVALGLLLGVWPFLYRILELPIEFFRALPVTAIFPLFLILFGVGDAAKIAMAFVPTFLLMIVNTSYGVIHAAPERRQMARAFGASSLQIFLYVVSFEALPQIFVGIRLSLSLSLIVTVVSEMFIGTDFGLGQRIYDSYLTNSVSTLYALLLVLGVLGYIFNKFLLYLEKTLVFWSGR